MAYLEPTLFGVAYTSWINREADGHESDYEQFVENTAQLEVGKEAYFLKLLKWLNEWGCRIANDRLPDLSLKLTSWFEKSELPGNDNELASLDDSDLDRLMHAYDDLGACGLGPTRAAKTLFAIRPRCAIPWDEPIREEFELSRAGGDDYRKMLELSRNEANKLTADANRHKVADILDAVGSAAHTTLALLLDEYHWVTITAQRKIPPLEMLERWISWHPITSDR